MNGLILGNNVQALKATPDAALIKLTRKVDFNSYLKPICLNYKEPEKPTCPDHSQDRGWLQ